MDRRIPDHTVPRVMYKVPNPQDNYSELFIIFGEILPASTDPDRCWVLKETHGFWDEDESNPDKKFRKNTDTLSPIRPEHCKTLDEVHELADEQVLFRAKNGFKYMFVRDFFDPPFYKRYEILPDGTRVELP